MDRPDDRRHTWPVKATEWEELLSELKRLATAPTTKKARPLLAHVKTLERISAKNHWQGDDFCVWGLEKQTNSTRDLNEVLQQVRRDGCLREGELLEGNYYVQLSPRLIALSDYALGHTIPEEFRDRLKPLTTTNGQRHILIWLVSGATSEKKLHSEKRQKFTEEERKGLLRGKVRKTPPGPALVVVVSPGRQGVVRRLAIALGNSVKVQVIVAGPGKLHDNFLRVQMARGMVIWVDEAITEGQLAAFAVAAHPENLFLVASDVHSAERARRLAAELPLAPNRCFEIDPLVNGKFGEVAAEVRQVIERDRSAEKLREECRAAWQKTQAAVGRLIEDPGIDAQIIKTAVLEPFQERAAALVDERGFSSRVNVQTEFIRVATPLYGQATEIYALNTDRHSTFWNSDAFDDKTKQQFLTRCPTVRLFLYGTPDALFRDIGTLNSQARHYQAGSHSMPEEVKLLVGDWERFQLAFPEQAHEDVAFIHHKSGDWYRFFLNEREVGARNIGREVDDPILKWLRELGADATKLAGRVTPTPTGRAAWSTFEYFRWEEKLQHKPIFGDSMKEVFFHNSRSGVHRVLTFRNDGRIDPEQFRKIVLRVHHALEKQFGDGQPDARKQYGLRSIEYGTLAEPSSHDRGGRPHHAGHNDPAGHAHRKVPDSQRTESRPREIIIIRFDTIKHLQDFSDSDELGAVRRALYRDILEALGVNVGRGLLPDNVYEAMRAAGNRYMTIHDYTDRHDLAEWIKLMRDEQELT
jgi:hypothetical protein